MLSERMTPHETIVYLMRTDRITVDRVRTAAKLGDPTAKVLFPSEGLIEWHLWQKQLEAFSVLPNYELLRFALTCVEHVATLFSDAYGKTQIDDALEVLRKGLSSSDNLNQDLFPVLLEQAAAAQKEARDRSMHRTHVYRVADAVSNLSYALASYVGLKKKHRETSNVSLLISTTLTASAQANTQYDPDMRVATCRAEQAWQKLAFIKALLTF